MMSVPGPTTSEATATTSSSSSWINNHKDDSTLLPPHTHNNVNKLEESDEDLFTVPDVEARSSTVNKHTEEKRRKGRNPVDKEYRRLKRLLRNRVSAQQARERKKVYVNELESKAKELQEHNSKLDEKISTLINENAMLRKVLMNTRPKVDQSAEGKD